MAKQPQTINLEDLHLPRDQVLHGVPPGLPPPVGTPSHGSVLHASAGCQPCAWFWKPGSCKNGKSCAYCHSCPEGELRARKKEKRTMMRLGIVTPKLTKVEVASSCEASPAGGFFLEPLFKSTTPELESTDCSESDPESATHGSSSELDSSTPCVSVGAPPESAGLPATCDRVSFSGLVNPNGDVPCPGEAAAELHDDDLDPFKEKRCSMQAPPGLDPPVGTPSHGSLLHEAGGCQPCAWFWKPSGCQNGKACTYCHACPEGELRARKKAKRTMMRLGLVTPQNSN